MYLAKNRRAILFVSAANAPKGYFSYRALIPWKDPQSKQQFALAPAEAAAGIGAHAEGHSQRTPRNPPPFNPAMVSRKTRHLLFPCSSQIYQFYQRANQNNDHSSFTITNSYIRLKVENNIPKSVKFDNHQYTELKLLS